ncbi:MAG: restriction endonuclease subunit S [Clostridia bacterium]|nr:restriction endonuclease subunit S [Clostridia bacterium]
MSRLGDFVNIKTGKLDANASSANGQYPFFTCSIEPLRIDAYSYDCECVLVAGNGDLNVKYYNGKFDAYQRTYIIESKNKDVLSVPYLYCFLDKYVEELRKQSIGGVIKYIKLGNLTEAQIPMCSISEQNEIVANLNKVDTLISIRKQQLSKLDKLVKSRFIEMFGDCKESRKLEDYAILITKGASPKWQGFDYCDEGVLFVTSENVREGFLDLSKRKYLPQGINDILPRSVLKKNDILINIVNASIGRVAIYDSDELANINQAVALVRIKPNVLNLSFLLTFLNSDEACASYDFMKVGGDKANLSLKNISDLKIPVASMERQLEFESFKKQVDKSKFEIEKSLEKLETLKKALIQKYFG